MLHEIILSLSGFSGSFLLQNLDEYVDLKNFLHPSEISILKDILKIAKDYQQVKEFTETNCTEGFGKQNTELHMRAGLYVQAFCDGVHTVLHPYRQEIENLEKEILTVPVITLLSIFAKVDRYSYSISLLRSLVHQIITMKLHGCQILQLLNEHSSSSVGEASESLNFITKKCRAVFIKQTSSWLLKGYLWDPFDEFVIQRNKILSAVASEQSDNEEVDRYTIAVPFLISYMPYSLVSDMLFIGETVETLTNNQLLETENLDNSLFEDENEFLKSFTEFSGSSILDVKKLEGIIREIHGRTVQLLCKVAVYQQNLYQELELMKNFYLLGYGELFVDVLKTIPVFSLYSRDRTTSNNDLNVHLHQIAYSYPYLDEATLNKFNLSISLNENSSKIPESGDLFWNSVNLNYAAKWPLSLLLTPVAVQNYNKLFRFLLRIRRCNLQILEIWKSDLKDKQETFEASWKLKNELMFLIENLLFYLLVDVIESEYNEFVSAVRKVQDFQQIQKLHNMFLLNILSHSFLLDVSADVLKGSDEVPSNYSEHFHSALVKNVSICEKFCVLSKKGELKAKDVEKLNVTFQKYKNIVLCYLAEYQNQPFKQHVTKLLSRLNSNSWVNKNLLTIPD